MIEIQGLSKSYGGFSAVDGVSLTIPNGQFTVLLGPSGSGKTTILRMLNRMVVPTSGRILVDGQDIAEKRPEVLRRTMGYVIQNTGLFPHMTVRRNVATVPRLLGWQRSRIDERVKEMLELVGLDPTRYADKLPAQLSGGEAQRVGVARALAADPPVLLMDEPFGAVDPITRANLQAEMKRLHGQLRTTIVFVTHDIDEAVLLGDRIALLRDGHLEQYASPEELWSRPANDFVSNFLGDDLGLRIMARRTVGTLELLPLSGTADGRLPVIDSSQTLREVLAELVDRRVERAIVGEEGRLLGEVTFATLVASLRSDEA